MEAVVFIILHIFFVTREFGEYHSNVPQFQLGHVRSRDAFRPIAHERKYLTYPAVQLVSIV